MIEILEPPADHVAALRVSGPVDTPDIDRSVNTLEATLDDHDRVSVYAEIEALENISPEALLKDLRYSFGQIKNLNRFYRAAVVTDQQWIKTIAAWESRLIPGIEVRSFSNAEREAARAWISETPPPRGAGLARLATDRPDLLGYAVRGPITGPVVEQIVPELESAFEAQDQIRLLVRIEAGHSPRVHLDALKGSLARLKRTALRRVERYAVVGGPGWVKTSVELLNPLLSMDIRHFDLDEEDVAWHWLGAAPSGQPAGNIESPN